MTGSDLFYNGKKVAYVPFVKEWGIREKRLVSKRNAKPGDIVIFNFGGSSKADHIGIIYANVGKGRSFKCIEGNTSHNGSQDNGGAVCKKIRPASVVSYIIRPKYNKDWTARNLISIAKSQVGVKEKPANSNKCKYTKEYGFVGAWCCMFVWWCYKHMKKNTPSTYPTIKYGMKNAWVGKAKKLLHKKGYKGINLKKGLNVYGKGTVNAVKAFQKKNKLKVDGQIGPKTWTKLCK